MTNLKKLASALAVLAVLPSVSARERDETLMPPAATGDERVTRTCEEARHDAELVREMKRTDGDMNPELPEVPECTIDDTRS